MHLRLTAVTVSLMAVASDRPVPTAAIGRGAHLAEVVCHGLMWLLRIIVRSQFWSTIVLMIVGLTALALLSQTEHTPE